MSLFMAFNLNHPLKTITGLILLVLPQLGLAQDQLALSLGTMKFDYTEYDTDGSIPDDEKGRIPGFSAEYTKQTRSGLYTLFGFDYYSGSVTYDGHLQSFSVPPDLNIDGVPYKSDTRESVTGFHLALAKPLTVNPDLTFYGKLSYKNWQRDIQGGHVSGIGNLGMPYDTNVGDTSETYRWYQFGLGARYRLRLGAASRVEMYAESTQTLSPEMKTAGITFKLKQRQGYQAGLNLLFDVSANSRIGVGAYFQRWEFGRSDPVTVNIGGSLFTLVEPKSKSIMSTLQLVFQKDFITP